MLEHATLEALPSLEKQGTELNGLILAYLSVGNLKTDIRFARAAHDRFLQLVALHQPEE